MRTFERGDRRARMTRFRIGLFFKTCAQLRRTTTRTSYFGYVPQAPLAQDFLNALDGKPLGIKQRPDPAKQLHIFGSVVASATSALNWSHVGEASLPKAKDVLWYAEFYRNLADSAEGL